MGLEWKKFVKFDKEALDLTQLEMIKLECLKRAQHKYDEITPIVGKGDLSECFTLHENHLVFWFNSADRSTHVVKYDLEKMAFVERGRIGAD